MGSILLPLLTKTASQKLVAGRWGWRLFQLGGAAGGCQVFLRCNFIYKRNVQSPASLNTGGTKQHGQCLFSQLQASVSQHISKKPFFTLLPSQHTVLPGKSAWLSFCFFLTHTHTHTPLHQSRPWPLHVKPLGPHNSVYSHVFPFPCGLGAIAVT